MITPYPITNFKPGKGTLAPGSFRRTALYRFKGIKPKPKTSARRLRLADREAVFSQPRA
jgi:hypothetical protein